MMLDSLLLFTSFVSGALTILAPCVLPLLPVIVGGAAGSTNKWYPFILTSSLAASVILFTLILKVSTLFISVPQSFWKFLSGGIVLFFGLILLLPKIWELITVKLNLLGRSQKGLATARTFDSTWGGILMGAALGPVFASCSPTYFVILATVLPVSFVSGLIYLIVYGIGLALMLGLIAFFGQKLTMHLGWAANPHGLFKKILGVLLVLVGLSILTGVDKKIETAILDAGLGVTDFETNLLNKTDDMLKEMDSALDSTTEVMPDGFMLRDLGPAPELTGLQNWINSESIASLNDLRGKVVLIDFWTYSCINCIRTLPYLQSWHEKYADEGLVILGLHAPEFQFEKKIENVQKAVDEFGLTYPVVQDNDFKTWRAYGNRYWPAKYLIDKDGRIRYTHFGEGEYLETEEAITYLLGTQMKQAQVKAQSVDFKRIGTRETYLGLERRENYVQDADASLSSGEWTLSEGWEADEERVVSSVAGASIRMVFVANKANLVIGGSGTARVMIDGLEANVGNQGADVQNGVLTLDGEKLYELANFQGSYEQHEILIQFDEPGAELFAWTFG